MNYILGRLQDNIANFFYSLELNDSMNKINPRKYIKIDFDDILKETLHKFYYENK